MTEQIISLLLDERDKLNRAIEALQGRTAQRPTDNDPPEWVTGKSETTAPAPKKKRKRSASGGWAYIDILSGTRTPIGKANRPKKKGGLTPEGRKALSLAMKARWAAKKKAAKK